MEGRYIDKYVVTLFAITIGVSTVVGSVPKAIESVSDFVPGPPTSETFASPDRTFEFVLKAPTENNVYRSRGMLFAVEGEARRAIWSRDLPHEIRARFALVDDKGYVVLFDEWLNTLSKHAITVIGPTGEVISRYSFDDIATALNVSRSTLSAFAKLGTWMSAEPRLDTAGQRALVETANTTLAVNMAIGSITESR